MKTIFKSFLLGMTFFMLTFCNISTINAQGTYPTYFSQLDPVVGRFVNSEIPVASLFTANAKIYFGDTITIDSLTFSLPIGFILSNSTNINGVHYPFDSLTFDVSIQNNNFSNLPFYPCEFTCKVNYTSHSIPTYTELVFMVYYTPYNTIEIWDLETFYSLPRRWLNSKDNPNALRIPVAQSAIPQTNIVDFSVYEPNSTNWNDWRFDNFREVEIDGLAYTVLMLPIPNDSIAYYDAIEDDSIKIEGNRSRTFTGTVTGRITAETEDGTGIIGLAGLRVELREQDGIWPKWYQNFGTTYTNNDGYYTIQYSESQANTEGNNIELYLRVSAIDDGTYNVISNNLIYITHTYQERIGSLGTNGGIITKNIVMADSTKYDAYRCVHWVRKGCMYFDDNTTCSNFRDGIRIRTHCIGNYSDNYAYLDKPTLHIKKRNGKYEERPRHEFGHTAMYFLQNKHMMIPYGVYGVRHHNYDTENTSLLAFYEGWANFVAAMLDAVYYQEDGEYGGEGYVEYECNGYKDSIKNGFRSEYNISTALYDLWDGPGKLSLQTIAGHNSFHAWNDSKWMGLSYNNWETTDSVELSLAEICAPLQTVTSESKLENMHSIKQYIDTLLFHNNTSCQYKRDIIRVFRENRVVWNVIDYNNKKSLGNLSIDTLFEYKSNPEIGHFYCLNNHVNNNVLVFFELPWSPVTWTDIYRISSLNENATNNWNFCPNTSNVQNLIDDYLVGYYNPPYSRVTNINLNIYNNNNVQTANFTTCGNDNVIKVRNGSLTLGSSNGTYKANLTIGDGSLLEISNGNSNLVVNDGSVLTISQGGTLCVKEKGNIIVNGSGRIEVEDGAYICLSDGLEAEDIFLQTSNSIINISEDALVGINPIHETNVGNHSCIFPCYITNSGYGSINCPCGFGIFDYYDDYIVSSSTTLTGETKIFKQDIIIQNGATLTLNNTRFEMLNNRKIIIKSGSKLVVDNSTITNSSYCTNKMWDGIYVVGDTTKRQLAQYQGTLEVKNGSLIENAKNAIVTWNGSDYATSGGIVQCSNSTFHNNRQCIRMYQYTNHNAIGIESDNVSYAQNCTFMVDDNNLFSSNNVNFCEFVKISHVRGVSFKGCSFRDGRATTDSQTKGIWSIDAGFTASEHCTMPYSNLAPCTCTGTETRTKFSRLGYGIYATNGGTTYNFTAGRAIFDTCYRAIQVVAVNNSKITRSSFDQTSQGVFTGSSATGVYLDNSSGYTVEGNSFTTNYTTCPSGFQGRGVFVQSSGSDVNTIYRNTMSNLYNGIKCNSSNSGLQVQCNEFSGSFNADIQVMNTISSSQGSSSKSAGNKFTPGATNFLNMNANNIVTYYNSGNYDANNVYCPYNSFYTTIVSNITANNCASTICIPIPVNPPGPKSAYENDDITLYESLQQIYETRLAEYTAAGYDFLLENFDVNDADIVATARLMQDTLISLSRAMAEIANRNINAILADSVLDRESLNGWYDRINTTTAKYSLANSYFETGEYSLARQELAAIPQRFTLSSVELAEYNNFCDYNALRESVYASGRNYAQLTEDEIAELEAIADLNTGVSSAYANSVLCFFYGICQEIEEPDFDNPQMTNKNAVATVEENSERESLAVYVYPNPADDELNILINSLPQGTTTIEFHDVAGRLMLSQEITSTNASIDISSLKQGIYMYRIVNGDSVIARDRIVKE